MDKQILKKLIDFGLITNICVDADKYATADELINAGIITIPGSRNVIDKLIGEVVEAPVVEIKDEDLDTKSDEVSVEVVSPVVEDKTTEVEAEEVIEPAEEEVKEEPAEDIESVEDTKSKKTKKMTK